LTVPKQLTSAPPGNKLSVKHGGNSPSIIAERAESIHDDLLSVAPWLDHDMFIPATARYLRATATEMLLDDYVRRTPIERVSSRTLEQLNGSRRLAARLASDLGLDPLGHARILALKTSSDVGQAGLDKLQETGRAILHKRFPDGLPALKQQDDGEVSDA
jgi:hypothetical protein